MHSPTAPALPVTVNVVASARNPKTGSIYAISQTDDPAVPFGHLVHFVIGDRCQNYRLSNFRTFDDINPGYRVAMLDGDILVIGQYGASVRAPSRPSSELDPILIDDLDIEVNGLSVMAKPKIVHVPRQLRDELRRLFAGLSAVVPGTTAENHWVGIDVAAITSALDALNIGMVALKAAATATAYDNGLQVRAHYVTEAALALRRYAARRDDGTADHWSDLHHLTVPVLHSVAMLLRSMWASPRPA